MAREDSQLLIPKLAKTWRLSSWYPGLRIVVRVVSLYPGKLWKINMEPENGGGWKMNFPFQLGDF